MCSVLVRIWNRKTGYLRNRLVQIPIWNLYISFRTDCLRSGRIDSHAARKMRMSASDSERAKIRLSKERPAGWSPQTNLYCTTPTMNTNFGVLSPSICLDFVHPIDYSSLTPKDSIKNFKWTNKGYFVVIPLNKLSGWIISGVAQVRIWLV